MTDYKDPSLLDEEDYPYQKPGPTPKWVKAAERGILTFEERVGGVSAELREESARIRDRKITGEKVSKTRWDILREERRERRRVGPRISESEEIQRREKLTGADPATLDIEHYPATVTTGPTPPAVTEITGLTLKFGAGLYDALTLPVRPTLITETVATGVGIVLSDKVRRQVLEVARRDPAGFTAEIAGGVAGGTLLHRGYKAVQRDIQRIKYGRLDTEIPLEDFYVKEDLMGQFPEPVSYTKRDVTLLTTTDEIKTLADSKFAKLADSAPEKFGDLDIQGRSILVRKSGDKTPLSKTFKEGYVPSGGRPAALVPQLEKAPTIDYVVPVTISRTGYTHRPGISFAGISPTITKPFPYGALFGGLTALTPKTTKIIDLDTPITSKTDEKTRTQQRRKLREKSISLNDTTVKQFPFQTITFMPMPPKPIQITRTTQTQRQRMTISPIEKIIQQERTAQSLPPIPFGYDRPGRGKRPLLPPLDKKMDGREYLKGLFAGEFRGYKLKDPKKILEMI